MVVDSVDQSSIWKSPWAPTGNHFFDGFDPWILWRSRGPSRSLWSGGCSCRCWVCPFRPFATCTNDKNLRTEPVHLDTIPSTPNEPNENNHPSCCYNVCYVTGWLGRCSRNGIRIRAAVVRPLDNSGAFFDFRFFSKMFTFFSKHKFILVGFIIKWSKSAYRSSSKKTLILWFCSTKMI